MSKTKATLITIGSIIVVIGICLGVYFAVFATANTRGRVALHNQLRNPNQIQFNYEYFHDTCHSIIAQTQQIATLQSQYDEAKKQKGSDPFGQNASRLDQTLTQITGVTNLRDSTAQDYDSKSNEFTRDYMKSRDLPTEIGPPNGVAYDQLICEGN